MFFGEDLSEVLSKQSAVQQDYGEEKMFGEIYGEDLLEVLAKRPK